MHEQYLLAALEQAWLGRGFCAPNPSVGAVAVLNGKIIAQAYHYGSGKPHAEQLIIEKLHSQLNIADVVLYVTLEPCNHWGKTPPCAEAIVKAQIKKVIYAYKDPNPIVQANDTPGYLRNNGVLVEFCSHPLIDKFYASYKHWTITKKPFVTAKLAHSLDGKIGTNGQRIQLSNSICKEFTHKQRRITDIILTTAKTINRDDPLLNVRLEHETLNKPLAIIQGKEKLNPKAKVFNTAKVVHIYESDENLTEIISHLGNLGYHDVWVEAGGTLFSALHKMGLVNKTYLYIVPKVLGQEAILAYHYNIFSARHKITWQKMDDNILAEIEWVV